MTARERRVIVAGAGIALAAGLLLRGAPAAVRASRSTHERYARRAQVLVDTRSLVLGLPGLRDSLATVLMALRGLAPDLVPGSSEAEADAALQSLLSGRAAGAALRVLQIQPVNDSGMGVIRRVRVRLELEGDIQGLTRFLAGMETGTPLLSASGLSVSALDLHSRPGAPETLRIRLEAVGLYLPREAS